ncbi:bZIP transcription factor [Colletotrichum tofieldiae]|uniref:BZIP transcription factor n=1 Tax=Colletotrichum tofieldiae TaxID=708197 RepID=A0A166Q5V3_9PEZI|nr:bZIP transcription factor [Colletotrichum tofieldiae]
MDCSAGSVSTIYYYTNRNTAQQQYRHLEENSAAFVPPSVTADPLLTADWESSISTESSQPWHESSFNNLAEYQSSPGSSMSPVDPDVLNPTKETQPVQSTNPTEPPKRRRGRPRLSSTKTTKKSKKQYVSSTSAGGVDDLRSHSESDNKKNKIRARNREAAHKCRQKAQRNIEKLKTQESIISDIHKSLTAEAKMLRGEVLVLKHMILQHSGCGCSSIEDYISSAAQNLVQSGNMTAAMSDGRIPRIGSQNCTTGDNQEGYMDWQLFYGDNESDVPSVGSWSVFSGFDDAASGTT